MVVWIFGGFTVFIYILATFLGSVRKLKYRFDFVYERSCNFYRYFFWFLEILYVPLLFNVSFPATCRFFTEREAIEMANCEE